MHDYDTGLAAPNPGDHLRTVPPKHYDSDPVTELYEPAVGHHAPPAGTKLVYGGGPLLTNVDVVTIFWGKGWQAPAVAQVPTKINAFFDATLTSSMIDMLAEYSTPTKQIGHGTRTATVNVTIPDLRRSVADGSIRHFLQTLITNKTVPAPTPNRLYFFYLPPGVRVVQGGGASCSVFCGYHDSLGHSGPYYAVMPYPTCNGCLGGLAPFDALTATSTHELCEAITDPVPGGGWYSQDGGEIGDLCAWTFEKVAGYTVQKEWSNRAGSCV
jgi:hypothetical protein